MRRGSDPFDGIERFFQRMADQFDRASQSIEDGPIDLEALGAGVNIDLRDEPERFVVTADVPGCESDDVDVTLDGRTLHIECGFETSAETTDAGYLRRERRHETTSRTITLPGDVDDEGVEAGCSNGVLTVELPKAHPSADGVNIDVE